MPIVAFRIGADPFYTYSLSVALGLLTGALWLAVETRRRWRGERSVELLAWALVPAVVGGRLSYLLAQGLGDAPFPRSLQTPWGEGLTFPGALVGGALGLAVFAALRRRPCLELLGLLAPGLALGQALGWLGAAAHGASAGVAMPTSGWAPHLRDLYGVILPRFPLQYVACGLSLATWAVMVLGRLRGGQRVACYATLTGWGLAGLLAWRDGRQALLGGLSAEQMGYLGLGVAGLVVVAAGRRRLARRAVLQDSG